MAESHEERAEELRVLSAEVYIELAIACGLLPLSIQLPKLGRPGLTWQDLHKAAHHAAELIVEMPGVDHSVTVMLPGALYGWIAGSVLVDAFDVHPGPEYSESAEFALKNAKSAAVLMVQLLLEQQD